MSTKRQRNLWRTGFLVVTVGALIMELFAAFDGNASTDPWTELISTYVPWQLALAVFGGLVVWLPFHFFIAYRRAAKRKQQQAAQIAAYKDALSSAPKYTITAPLEGDEHNKAVAELYAKYTNGEYSLGHLHMIGVSSETTLDEKVAATRAYNDLVGRSGE